MKDRNQGMTVYRCQRVLFCIETLVPPTKPRMFPNETLGVQRITAEGVIVKGIFKGLDNSFQCSLLLIPKMNCQLMSSPHPRNYSMKFQL